MEMKMATINKAEELIEDLQSASWNAAIQGSVLPGCYLEAWMEYWYIILLDFWSIEEKNYMKKIFIHISLYLANFSFCILILHMRMLQWKILFFL